MYTLKRERIVPYSSQQMFELVNNIEHYPQFLPWCVGSHIIKQTDKEMIASLKIAWKGIHKQFTTRNYLTPYKQIDITLVNGPIKHMEGIWIFNDQINGGCHVHLNLEFEFTGRFVDRLLQPMFQHIANALVDAFCERAKQCYDK